MGEGVQVEATAAPGASVEIVEDASAPFSEYESASKVFRVQASSAIGGEGTRIALPTTWAEPPSSDEVVPLVVVADSLDGPWEPLLSEVEPGGTRLIATTPHFSFFTSVLLPVRDILDEARRIFDQATSGVIAEASQPICQGEELARTRLAVASDGPDTLKWCFGQREGGLLLKTANSRRYPVSLAHTSGEELPRERSALDFANLARFAAPGTALLLPRDEASFNITGPVIFKSEFDGTAQSIYALQVGIETAIALLTKFGLAKGEDVNAVLDAAFKSTKCGASLQPAGQAGTIIRECLGDPALLIKAFGARGLFLGALLTVTPVLAFFQSSFNALGDQLNGRDRYTIDITAPAAVEATADPTPTASEPVLLTTVPIGKGSRSFYNSDARQNGKLMKDSVVGCWDYVIGNINCDHTRNPFFKDWNLTASYSRLTMVVGMGDSAGSDCVGITRILLDGRVLHSQSAKFGIYRSLSLNVVGGRLLRFEVTGTSGKNGRCPLVFGTPSLR